MSEPIKLREYTLSKRGKRGLCLSIPLMWANDNGLIAGDTIEVWQEGTSSNLILRTRKGSRNEICD